MKSVHKIILVTAISAVFAGCATPRLNAGGEKVRVLAPDEVSSCRQLGKTNATVLDKVVGINRPIESMAEELETMGRNSAANMGGDTIVPLTVVENGSQSFIVYKCIDPQN
ncbi:MAG: DUF4156 domain-containing protein [Gammaproteobacteria bacterium]|nr:DUF4156 domain-containing protein [Gammaproteobacteria bacterium]MCZ6882669.1 DUF4156 domain-containing protein [Gammaproteobacteria bacterium]